MEVVSEPQVVSESSVSSQVVSEPSVSSQVVSEPSVSSQVVSEPVSSSVTSEPVSSQVVSEPVSSSVTSVTVTDPRIAELIDLQSNISLLYNEVNAAVNAIIFTGKLDSGKITPLMICIIGIVQRYAEDKYTHITGADKKTIALNILNKVIKDLYEQGKISQDDYQLIILSLDFFGGPLIDLAKAAWTKAEAVIDDIQENGLKNCCGRNFFSKKDKSKSKSRK